MIRSMASRFRSVFLRHIRRITMTVTHMAVKNSSPDRNDISVIASLVSLCRQPVNHRTVRHELISVIKAAEQHISFGIE